VLRHHLAGNGVDLRYSVDAPEPPTLAVVTLDDRGRPSYTFYGPETADWQLSAGDLPFGTGTGPGPEPAELGLAVVHTGSLLTTLEPSATVIEPWLQRVRLRNDIVISFDPNVRADLVSDPKRYLARMETLIASSHIVKASTEDIGGIYSTNAGEEDLSSPCIGEIATRWLELGARLVVLTAGEQGAAAFHCRGWRARERPPRVAVKDTIGAGDAVTSALLAYLSSEGLLTPKGVANLSEEQVREALHRAVAASAFTCTRWGGDPPTSAELAQWLADLAAR